jgi:hypothetical protein
MQLSLACRSTLRPTLALLLVTMALWLPTAVEAKDKGSSKHGNSKNSKSKKSSHSKHDDDHDQDHDHRIYSAVPRTSFFLSYGNGYAGRGFYYGPRNSSYYYQRPEVKYYATREAAPREYYQSDQSGVAVQRALARAGYYQGAIDGAIGPQSRRAIARYQSDNGLRSTGLIDRSLLNSLGL